MPERRTALVAACRRDSASSSASSALCDFSAALRRSSSAFAFASFSCFCSSFTRSLAVLNSVSAAFASLYSDDTATGEALASQRDELK